MKYLLDTHVFLWWITDDKRLSAAYRRICADPQSELWLSVASIWEMVIKSGLRRLPLPEPTAPYVFGQMEKNRIVVLPIRPLHFSALEELPPLHRDPFDRMLLAQAVAEGMTVLSGDDVLRNYAARFL